MAIDAGLRIEAAALRSYLAGAFVQGTGPGCTLVDPVSGRLVARVDSSGLDLAAGFDYARTIGGPALRGLTFKQRAAALGRIADVLGAAKERWYAIARSNSGNTRSDAVIDVDGAIGTLNYYAKIGADLGDATFLRDGDPIRLARDPNFQGLHLGVPLEGVALHINAFNFPAWGLWEKAAVALLAGVPVIAKAATATAVLAAEMVEAVIDANILPPGSLSFIAGPAGQLLDHVRPGDAVAFTGSAETARKLRDHPRVRAGGVRFNVEADSLNAALLGPDTPAGSVTFDAFVREVAREMTVKAGQKCTAIRRVIVPDALSDAVVAAIAAQLAQAVVGDPSDDAVTMGPLVSQAQRDAVEAGIAQLAACTTVVYRSSDEMSGRFVSPTLLLANDRAAALVHELEIFGPVATVITYRDAAEAFELARRGGGSLAISVFSEDAEFLASAARALTPAHGRVMLVDPAVAATHTGHGIVLPSLIHGGPGRAGGGEELGGLRGLAFYSQWSAVQGPASVLQSIAARAASVRA